jgi:two-component sensor histidine kinase
MRKDAVAWETVAASRPQTKIAPTTAPDRICDECQIVQEADHRIANDLALLAGFIRLKAAEFARESATPQTQDVLLLLESVRSQIASIAHLHAALARQGPNASADLAERLRDVCASLAAILSNRMELIEDFLPGIQAPAALILPVTQIVAEVITNAIKHAARPGHIGIIMVRCRTDETGGILIEVVDDGPGLAEGVDPLTTRGLGFRLIRALGKQIGARIEFESTRHGLCFRLTLPPGSSAPVTIAPGY